MASAQDKRQAMAKVFMEVQTATSKLVDDVSMEKRRPVPYATTYKGPEPSTGPVPRDAHLIPSERTTLKRAPIDFSSGYGDAYDAEVRATRSSGAPYAFYQLPQHSIFAKSAGETAEPTPVQKRTAEQEEMWRAQYMEWVLQKNAFNPDIAASLRTNVRKQASLCAPPLNKPQDPARTSENVKLALTDSTGVKVINPPKTKIGPSVYNPTHMA